MKNCVVLAIYEGGWSYIISVPVSEAEDAQTVQLRVEVDGPYPDFYYCGMANEHVMVTDIERQFAVEQAKKFVFELVRKRP